MKTSGFLLIALAAVVGFASCDKTPPIVTDIGLSDNSLLLLSGESHTLTAELGPDDAPDKSLTWHSDNKAAAFVDAGGRVMAVGSGRANITATAAGGKTALCRVTVATIDDELPLDDFDPAFRLYLLSATIDARDSSTPIDADGNGKITVREALAVTGIRIDRPPFYDCSSLTGIEYFRNLTELYCNEIQLTALDISQNRQLTFLDCGYNEQLTALDVSKNSALTVLFCIANVFTALDLSKNTELEELICHDGRLNTLDLSRNPRLRMLYCYLNRLTDLDLSHNAVLDELYCGSQQQTLRLTLPASLYNRWEGNWKDLEWNENVNVIYR